MSAVATDLPTQFRSDFKCYVHVVRHGHINYHPTTGVEISRVKRLAAEFGVHGGEYMVIDADGRETGPYADIRGHFFDIDVAAENEEWDDDEKEAVRSSLIRRSKTWPEACRIHAVAKAPIPFPNYAGASDEAVAQLCINLGFAAEALAYERENGKREAVIAELEAFLTPTDDETEELTAA